MKVSEHGKKEVLYIQKENTDLTPDNALSTPLSRREMATASATQ